MPLYESCDTFAVHMPIPRLEKFSVFSSVCYDTVVGLIETQLQEFEINMRLEEERLRGLVSPGGMSSKSKRRKVAAASSLGGQNLVLSRTCHNPTHSKVVLSHQLQTHNHDDMGSRQRGGGDHHHTRADGIQTAAVREGGPAPHLGDGNHDPTTSTGELFCVANQVQEFLSRVVGLLHLDMVVCAAGSFSAAGSTLSTISATSWGVLLEILVKAKGLFQQLQGANLTFLPNGTGLHHVVSKSCKNRDRRREVAKHGDHYDVCSLHRSTLWLSTFQQLITEKGVAVLREAVGKTTATSSAANRRKSLLPAQQQRRVLAGGENNFSRTNKLRIFDYRKADSDAGCRADEQAENCPDPPGSRSCGHADGEHHQSVSGCGSLSLIRHFDTGLQHYESAQLPLPLICHAKYLIYALALLGTVCMTSSGSPNSTTLLSKFIMRSLYFCWRLYCCSCNTNEGEGELCTSISTCSMF